jgi:hypothetical protein
MIIRAIRVIRVISVVKVVRAVRALRADAIIRLTQCGLISIFIYVHSARSLY